VKFAKQLIEAGMQVSLTLLLPSLLLLLLLLLLLPGHQ
jgi:hypothetical protein